MSRKSKPQNPKRKPVLVTSRYRPKHGAYLGFNNGLVPPVALSKAEQQTWNQAIARCPWLDNTDIPNAVLWVRLWCKYLRTPNPSAAMQTRLSNLQSKLFPPPTARQRLGRPRPVLLPTPSKASKYFSPDDGAA